MCSEQDDMVFVDDFSTGSEQKGDSQIVLCGSVRTEIVPPVSPLPSMRPESSAPARSFPDINMPSAPPNSEHNSQIHVPNVCSEPQRCLSLPEDRQESGHLSPETKGAPPMVTKVTGADYDTPPIIHLKGGMELKGEAYCHPILPSSMPPKTYPTNAPMPLPPLPAPPKQYPYPPLLTYTSYKPKKGKPKKFAPPLAPPPPPPGPVPSMIPEPFLMHSPTAPDLELVTSHTEFIPTIYADDSKPEDKLVRTIFKKTVYTTFHTTGPHDLTKHLTLLRAADPETWYAWPTAADEAHITALCASNQLEAAVSLLVTEVDSKPISPLNASVPRVWASPAVTTPLDDDVYACLRSHDGAGRSYSGACDACTARAAATLTMQGLVYMVILSTYADASGEFGRGPSPTEKVFKVFKCGRRESAAAEAFYAAGVQGWDIVFSCVIREDVLEVFKRGAKVARVEKLYELGHENGDEARGDTVRVFY